MLDCTVKLLAVLWLPDIFKRWGGEIKGSRVPFHHVCTTNTGWSYRNVNINTLSRPRAPLYRGHNISIITDQKKVGWIYFWICQCTKTDVSNFLPDWQSLGRAWPSWLIYRLKAVIGNTTNQQDIPGLDFPSVPTHRGQESSLPQPLLSFLLHHQITFIILLGKQLVQLSLQLIPMCEQVTLLCFGFKGKVQSLHIY